MSGARDTTSYMPTFDEVMHEHEQLQRWGKPGQPKSQPVDYETHIRRNTTFFGVKPGPGLKTDKHSPDVNF